jgi:hypothetical protein
LHNLIVSLHLFSQCPIAGTKNQNTGSAFEALPVLDTAGPLRTSLTHTFLPFHLLLTSSQEDLSFNQDRTLTVFAHSCLTVLQATNPRSRASRVDSSEGYKGSRCSGPVSL